MIVNGGHADSGERDRTALGRPAILSRRSFLVGSARRPRRARARRLRDVRRPDPRRGARRPTGRCRTRNSRSRRSTSARSIRNTTAGPSATRPRKRPARSSSIPPTYYVYRIEGDGSATRYGANVGRDGFLWNGDAYVGRKSEWATWTPPKEMIRRQPEAAKYARGMPGGLDNPLGARTLHLYQNGAYTLYTIYASSDARIDRHGHHQRLRRPAQPGHDPPLRAHAGQDEGRRPAGVARALPTAGRPGERFGALDGRRSRGICAPARTNRAFDAYARVGPRIDRPRPSCPASPPFLGGRGRKARIRAGSDHKAPIACEVT